MSFARLHELVTYCIAALGLLALCLGPTLSATSEVLIWLAFVASWWARPERVRGRRWARGWTAGLLVFLGLQVLRGATGGPILELVLEFAAALQISRLFNRESAREHQQIAALALLHLIAATVLSSELSYGLAFLGFVVVTPWMLALSHLRAEIEAQHQARFAAAEGVTPCPQVPTAAAEGVTPCPQVPTPAVSGGDEVGESARHRAIDRVLASRRLVGPGFLLGTAALALPAFALTGLVFVAFPRVGLGYLSFGRGIGQPVSGFGGNVELGDFGVIRTDPTVVLRVTPPDLPAQPAATASLRMRGTSFDHYDGRRWSRSRDLSSQPVGHVDSVYPVPVRLPRRDHDRPWQIVLDPLEEPVLFLPPNTVALEIPPRVQGGIAVGRQVTRSPGVDIRYDDDGLGLRYVAWTGRPGEQRRTDPALLRRYLQVPEGHRRVAELARRWTDGAQDDVERARRLLQRLRDSGEYTYSLQTPTVGDQTPLDVFLFEAQSGHCEYYSTALAIMLRTLGIPSRNVTGFLGGSYNAYGGYYTLRQGDAHSWVEAWLPERGWVTLDPTPAARDAIRPDAGWFAVVGELLDAARTRWSEDVVGYDLRSQVSLARRLRRWLRPSPGSDRAASAGASEPERLGDPGGRRWLWPLALTLALLGAAGAWWWRQRRGSAGKGEPAEERARAAIELYRALDARLSSVGHPRPLHRTPVEHLARLRAAGFAELDLVAEITARYMDARYGGRSIPAANLDALRRRVRQIASD